MPRVSIIIPSYNHARFVPQCVESVLAQTFTDWEMVVVDDGSQDGSLELFRSYGDDRISVFKNDNNLGTYGTQNRAVDLSSGEWIAVLNSDDWWAPEKLDKQIDHLERWPEAPFSYTRGWLPNETGDYKPTDDNYFGWPLEERLDIVPYMLDFNRLMASSVVFRREWATFDAGLHYSGDWIASLRAAYSAPPACVCEPLTYWRQHGENTSKRFQAVTREEVRVRRAIVNGRANWRLPRVDSNLVNERVGQCAYHLCAVEMLWGCVREARATSRLSYRLIGNKRQGFRRMAMCHLPRPLALKRFFPGRPTSFDRREIDAQDAIEWRLPDPSGGWPGVPSG